jgi:hypothetical protein
MSTFYIQNDHFKDILLANLLNTLSVILNKILYNIGSDNNV